MAPCGKRYARLQTRRLSLHKDHGEGTIVLLLSDRNLALPNGTILFRLARMLRVLTACCKETIQSRFSLVDSLAPLKAQYHRSII
jgi:hypothetical protein